MDAFPATVRSLGETVVAWIGKDHLSRLEVYPDEADGAASVVVYLSDNDSWEEHSRAIDKMIEIRGMFMDDLAIDYRFAELDDETLAAAEANHPSFVMA